MTTKLTQSQAVLSYLKSGWSLSPREASDLIGCDRLAARIKELRDQGHKIITRREKHNGGTHARYELEGV